MTEKKTEATLDFEASAAKLAEWLATFRDSEWTPTKGVKELKALAKHLVRTADMLDSGQWMYLEHVFDTAPDPVIMPDGTVNYDPPEFGPNGWPITTDETNAGRYSSTVCNLRDLASTALREANQYPNSRAKPELARAANLFLHIWLEAGKDRPTFYDGAVTEGSQGSEAVSAFKSVLDGAGYVLSKSRVRGILIEAWALFDPHFFPEGSDTTSFFVWRQ